MPLACCVSLRLQILLYSLKMGSFCFIYFINCHNHINAIFLQYLQSWNVNMIYNVKCQLILNRSLDNVTIQVEVGENSALKSFWQVHSAQVVSFIVISIKFWNGAWIEIASHLVQNYVSQRQNTLRCFPAQCRLIPFRKVQWFISNLTYRHLKVRKYF